MDFRSNIYTLLTFSNFEIVEIDYEKSNIKKCFGEGKRPLVIYRDRNAFKSSSSSIKFPSLLYTYYASKLQIKQNQSIKTRGGGTHSQLLPSQYF